MNVRRALLISFFVLGLALSAGGAQSPGSTELYAFGEATDWWISKLPGDDAFLDMVVANMDVDLTPEIVVVGYVTRDGSDRDAFVGIYRMAGGQLVSELVEDYVKDFRDGHDALNAVVVADYDHDGVQEIIVTGYATNAVSTSSQEDIIVGILRVTAGRKIEQESTSWYTKNFAGSAASRNYGLDIAVSNLDDPTTDPTDELIVVTRDDFGAFVDTSMRVGVLDATGGTLTDQAWAVENPTSVLDYWSAVEVQNIDNDNDPEIVVTGTCGEYWSSICAATYVLSGGSVKRESQTIYLKRAGAQNNHAGGLAIANVHGAAAPEVIVVGNFDDAQVNSDYGNLALGVLSYADKRFSEAAPWLNMEVGKPCAGYAYAESDFWPALSIANLDRDPTLEIVVGGYATGACTKYDLVVGAFSVSGGKIEQESAWYWKDFGGTYDFMAGLGAANFDSDPEMEIALTGYQRATETGAGDQIAVILRPELPDLGGPDIEKVPACFDGAYFLQDVVLDNRFGVQVVNWKDGVGSVTFTLNNHPTSATPEPPGFFFHTYNMGGDLGNYALTGGDNQLSIVAQNSNGARATNVVKLYGFSAPRYLPVWSVSDADCPKSPQAARYSANVNFPSEPVDASVKFPDWFPYLGGQSYGLQSTQATLDAELVSTGQAALEVSGQTGFEAAGQPVAGTLSGSGSATITPGKGIEFTDATLRIGISGEIKQTKGIVDVIPQLKPLEKLWGVGQPIKWFNKKAKLEATIEPEIDTTLYFESKDGGWSWKSADATVQTGMTLALVVDVHKNLSASAYGGGTPQVTIQVPKDPSYLKEVSAELLAGVKLTAFDAWSVSREKTHTWSYTPAPGAASDRSPTYHSADSPEWQVIGREHVTDPTRYGLFVAGDPASAAEVAPTRATTETQIVAGIFPYSHVALAAGADQALLLWEQDNLAKPVTESLEISYALWSQGTWRPGGSLTDNSALDIRPAVVFDGAGKAVAVWQHATEPIGAEPTITFTKGIELAYAVWDGTRWSAPQLLTDNDALDHRASLASAGNGKVLLAWVTNADGELVGSAAALDTINVSVWDGAAWSAPTAVSSMVAGLLDLSAAYRGDEAVIVYSRDSDDDTATVDDAELMAHTWQNGAWSEPAQLTVNNVPDVAPTVLYGPDDAEYLLWVSDETLMLRTDLNGAAHAALTEPSVALLDYRAGIDAQGNLAVIWQGLAADGADMYYSVYDADTATFRLKGQLTSDRSLERAMAPVFKPPTGGLWVAYARDELAQNNVVISPTLTISNVTTFTGVSDLWVLEHQLYRDVAISAEDLRIWPMSPLPGQQVTISATVRNLGDLGVRDLEVAFYQGDPDGGGTLIGTPLVPGVLRGGATATISQTCTLPVAAAAAVPEPVTAHVRLDPRNLVAELDETNGQASVGLLMADLAIKGIGVRYGPGQQVVVTAACANDGPVRATGVPAELRLDGAAGPLIASTVFAQLDPGEQTEVVFTLDAGGIATGWHKVFALINPGRAVAEPDWENNTEWTGLAVLPNPTIGPGDISVRRIGASMTITATIHNNGLRGASGLPVGIYDRWPAASAAPLATEQIDLAAGQSKALAFQLSRRLQALYVAVNPHGEVEEISPGDNIALYGAPPNWVYLPNILRSAISR